MDLNNKYVGCLGGIIGILFVVGMLFLAAWFLILLWNWLAPLFWAGAPELNIFHGVGVLLFLGFLKMIFTKE